MALVWTICKIFGHKWKLIQWNGTHCARCGAELRKMV